MSQSPKNPYLLFVGIGIELVGIAVTMAYLGHLVDKKMGWPGYGIAGLTIAGLIFWLYHVVVLLKKIEDGSE